MRKNYFFFKSLLLATVLLLGSANAWGYTPTLTDALEVSGYKAKAYYDISNTNVNSMCGTEGDFRYRGSGYGMFDFGSGNRSGDVVLPFSKDDLIILDFKDSQGRSVTVNSVENCTKDETLSSSTGFLVFKATANSDAATTINVGRGGCIIAILVMEIDESAKTADYTINYKDGETTVKTVSGSDVAVGTKIYIESSFFKDDVKYITNDGQISSFNIAEGSNVYNIEVSEAAIYSYTVNATDGTNILKVLATGSTYSDETVKVAFPSYFNIDGILYHKNPISNEYRASVTVSENEQVTNLVYSATDIKNVMYYSEGEEVTGASETTGGNIPIRSSNAKCGIAPSDITLINLPAGVYQINVVFYAGANTGYTIPFMLGDEAWDAVQPDKESGGGASNWIARNKEFTLTSAADVKWLTSGDSKNGLDFVYIQKTAELFTISSASGFATLYTGYALDFEHATPAGLKAYTATYDSENYKVILSDPAVDNVPAETGVVLKGAATTYTIPVLASSSTAKGDLTGSVTDNTPIESTEYDFYGLALNGKGEAQFTWVSSGEIPAGKAFLMLTKGSSPAKSLRVVVDGQASEITAPEVVETEEPEVLYNMAGIPVGKDFKGYVINQKGEKRLQR